MSKRNQVSSLQTAREAKPQAGASGASLRDVTFRKQSHLPLDIATSPRTASTRRRTPPAGRPIRRSRRKRWLRRLLVIVLVLLGLFFGGHTLLTASYFQVQHIIIEGTDNAEVLAAIGQLHLEGGNIFLTDTNAQAARVESLPPLASARITRSLPNTLVVQVVERQPVLIWQVGTAQYTVDAGGVLIAQAQQPDKLPIVTDEHKRDLRGRPFEPGGKIDPQIVQMAWQLLERLPTEISITFSLDDTLQYGLVMRSSDGWLARFGGPDNLENKIQELAAIVHLVKQQGQQLALVDLRFGFYPYYRLESSSGPGA